jgi:predicted nucleic acid-binding protein
MLTDRIVVDSSALLEMLGPSPDRDLARRIWTSIPIAPEIIDLEVLHVLRRLVRHDPAVVAAANAQVTLLPGTPITRIPHRILVGRIWQLRHAITAYDGAYVALAERLGVPLVTCDAKLARSNGHHAKIELYPRG